MHLWPTVRLRESFKKAYVDKMDRNLHCMKRDKETLSNQQQNLLLSDNNNNTTSENPRHHICFPFFTELLFILSCCYCCFCCGACVEEEN